MEMKGNSSFKIVFKYTKKDVREIRNSYRYQALEKVSEISANDSIFIKIVDCHKGNLFQTVVFPYRYKQNITDRLWSH